MITNTINEWEIHLREFQAYLLLEKSLSNKTLEAYTLDVTKFLNFMEIEKLNLSPKQIKFEHLKKFIFRLNDIGVEAQTQARIISGLRSFFIFLIHDEVIKENPAELLESPRLIRKLPDTLSINEIDLIISNIDLSNDEGIRNKAIIETLYGSGLRVSELVDLKIASIDFDNDFIRVIGKGNKERLVPLSPVSKKCICSYIENVRNNLNIKIGNENILFLNRRGSKLSRVMIFIIIKELTLKANIHKNISPHTFRHSFASHLIEGGADLRAIQEMLGHESITTTEIYTHIDTSFLKYTITEYHPRSNYNYKK